MCACNVLGCRLRLLELAVAEMEGAHAGEGHCTAYWRPLAGALLLLRLLPSTNYIPSLPKHLPTICCCLPVCI